MKNNNLKKYLQQNSKDDSDHLIIETRKDTAEEQYNKEIEEDKKKVLDATNSQSIFSETTSYLNDRLIAKPIEVIKNTISSTVNTAITFVNPVLENPLFIIATSTPTSRLVTATLGAMAVTSAFTLATFPAVIAGAIGALSVTAVGISTVSDIKKIDNLKKLENEYKSLVVYKNARNKQDYLLELNPNLSDDLKDKLTVPQKKSIKIAGEHQLSTVPLIPNPQETILSNISGVASTIEQSISAFSGNPVDVFYAIKATAETGYSLISSNLNERQVKDLENIFKLAINDERKKDNAPNYENIKELELASRQQVIQTKSIVQLITDTNYWTITSQDRKDKFELIRAQMEKENVSIFDSNLYNIAAATLQAHNPYYKHPAIERAETSLSKIIEQDEGKKTVIQVPDTIKHKLQKNLSEPIGGLDDKQKHSDSIQNQRKIKRRHSVHS